MKNVYYLTSIFLLGNFFMFSQEKESSEEIKTKDLKEVTVTKAKKAVEQRPDRTIFNFDSQPQLSTGSVLEGLKKLPGLIVSDVAGMVYQGKQLEVYLDGRPLNISSNELNAFLEGMPANTIEKVEVITQPGAEFPATSGGAIINIITSRKAKSYLSATYSNGFSFTDYDKTRARFNNSIMLNAKNKYFGWQLSLGQNYAESGLWSTVSDFNNGIVFSENTTDRRRRGQFVKSALTFDLKKDRILLNYDVNFNNNDATIFANGIGFTSNDFSKDKGFRQDALVTYQKRFEDRGKKLEFRFNFNQNDNTYDLNGINSNASVLSNGSIQNNVNFRIDYSQKMKLLEEGKISFGTLLDNFEFDTESFGTANLNYNRRTAAGYVEMQTSYKKFDFIAGARAEDYAIDGKTTAGDLIPFNQFKVFPNASLQYNFGPQIFFSANYNKKISLPRSSALNPNNTNYQNPNLTYNGNPQLEPTIFNNYEVKISAFDYAFLGYSISDANNQVVTRVLNNSTTISSLSINVPHVRVHNLNIGLPIPYMLFTKGLTETLKFDFNPDSINFLYAYAGYQKHEIQDFSTKGFWIFNLMSQIVLPKDIKFITNYNYSTPNGNYYYFVAKAPFSHSLDVTFSKKFLNDRLSIALNVDDILNTNKQAFASAGTPIFLQSKQDTRRFGFTLNYKLPTKNKLAKVDQNLLNDSKKESDDTLIK